MQKHLFAAKNACFYAFGATFKPLFTTPLSWNLFSNEMWAVIGPSSDRFLAASLLGRARASPAGSRRWPFLEGRQGYMLDKVVQRVAFKTRLEAKGPSAAGEFTDFTARYGGHLSRLVYNVRSRL